MRLTLRVVAMGVGIFGAVVAFVINALYSSAHVLGRVAGITANSSHFFWGLLVAVVGLVGAVLAPISAEMGAILMLVAGIALFFIVGWWALLASPFLFVAAGIAYWGRRGERGVRATS